VRNLTFLWLALSALIVTREAAAYPSFIGYGYTSCLNCHYNPQGNGPLTDYGRAVSATAISARPPFATSLTDDQLGEKSGFFFGHFPQDYVRPQLGYRPLWVVSNLQNASQRASNTYLMQLDGMLVLKTADDRYWMSLEGGLQLNAPSSLISREHYVGAVLTENLWGGSLRAMVGFMDIAYGIRVPDHNLFSRKATLLAQNDQTHGALLHYASERGEATFHAFMGNLTQDSALRLKGISGTSERQMGDKSRLGGSALYFTNDFRSRFQAAGHWRQGFGEGQSLLLESGLIFESPTGLPNTTGYYVMSQGLQRLFRGFHLLGTLDGYIPRFDASAARQLRLSPGIQWFTFQRLEIRAELQSAWTFAGGDTAYALNFLGQLHVSL
jgi:hypothetical protein